MSNDEWINFFHPDGRCLCSYTVRGTFAGECQATKRQLAAEYGIKEREIKVTLTKKAAK